MREMTIILRTKFKAIRFFSFLPATRDKKLATERVHLTLHLDYHSNVALRKHLYCRCHFQVWYTENLIDIDTFRTAYAL
jgi:hypothetical protein